MYNFVVYLGWCLFQTWQLMAMALVHGGSAVRLFSRSVFQYLKGIKPCDIVVDINEYQKKLEQS